MMDRSSDTTTLSPTPFSPFSSAHSFGSEGGTSDEPADLGQFNSVFRALNEIALEYGPHPAPRTGTPSSSLIVSASDLSDNDYSRQWTQDQLLTHLANTTIREGRMYTERELSAGSDTEGDEDIDADGDAGGDFVLGRDLHSTGVDQPSLGYLDDVLGFIAAERARYLAEREAGLRANGSSHSQASASESPWRHVIEPRRKRRRKRGKGGGSSAANTSGHEREVDHDADGFVTPVGDTADGSSSGPDHELHGKSMPATPPHVLRKPQSQLKLHHSRSTPSLRVAIPSPPDPRVLRLRSLATKLRLMFTEDTQTLSAILLKDIPESIDFIDPRGRPPQEGDPLVHVFIDHSNILIGFINHLRRYPVHPTRRTKTHMSHAALVLILERGRYVSRRVLATSKPLYQPVDGAEKLGYEVHVYARVPDTGDGADRLIHTEKDTLGFSNRSPNRSRRPAHGPRAPGVGHSRRVSGGAGGVSADSDPGTSAAATTAAAAAKSSPSKASGGHSRSTSLTVPGQSSAQFIPTSQPNANAPSSSSARNTSPSNGRVRYREQGVDELLQLKLHQAIAEVDGVPPPGSTIVLATGDGNVGQFNEEGFLGAVRTALKKGWRVELYAWEVGLSKAWMKEFGTGSSGSAPAVANGNATTATTANGTGDGSKGGDTNGTPTTSSTNPYGDRFRIVGLEKFAQDLLDIP